MSKQNIEEIASLSMTERLMRWKQARAAKGFPSTSSSAEKAGKPLGKKNRLYDRFQKGPTAFDEALGPQGDDGQNADPNKIEEQKAVLKKKTKRRTSGSVLNNLSPGDPKDKESQRRSSLGSIGSSGGKKKKASSRRSSAGSTGSIGGGSSPKISAKKHTEAIEALEASKDEEIKKLHALLAQANQDKEAAHSRKEHLHQQMQATWGEIQAQFFLNGTQEQEISSLQGDLSVAHFESAEEAGDRRRKFRAEKKRLDAENAQLREMGQELSEQMEQMNEITQARFAELEQEVGAKQKEIDGLHSQIGSMKLREVQSRMEVASVTVKLQNLRRSSGGGGSSRGSTGSGSATDEAEVDAEDEEGYDTE